MRIFFKLEEYFLFRKNIFNIPLTEGYFFVILGCQTIAEHILTLN